MKLTVFIGTYTSGESKGIYSCRFDDETGGLSDFRLAAETPDPSFLALHPNGKFLYAVNETKDGEITAFEITDVKGGVLKKLNTVPAHGGAPCHLALTPSSKSLITANYHGATVCVVEIKSDGSLGKNLNVIKHEGSSVKLPRQSVPHPHAVNIGPTGKFAYIADLGMDEILRYGIKEDGSLSKQVGTTKVKGAAGPRHFAFHPSGQYGYVLNEMNRTITAFTVNKGTGDLKEIQTVSTVPEGWEKGSTAEIVCHPNGKWLYSSNRGHDSIACFAIDLSNGRLGIIDIEKTGGRTPRNFNLAPEGKHIIAANQSSSDLHVFDIDQKTGALAPGMGRVEVPNPVCVVFCEK